MPVLVYFVAVGFALVALLFVADATLERGSPAIVTSDRIGLPERSYSNTIQTLTGAPARAPDMTLPAVLAAQPKSEPKFEPTARAEAPPDYNRITPPIGYRQNPLADRFSINGQ
jgi:hypothetical protein